MGGHKRKIDPGPKREEDTRKKPHVVPSIPSVPASQVNLVESEGKSCTHEVAWPPGSAEAHSSLPPGKRPGPSARTYAFTLDPFQQTAVNCLEAGKARCRRESPIVVCTSAQSALREASGQSLIHFHKHISCSFLPLASRLPWA